MTNETQMETGAVVITTVACAYYKCSGSSVVNLTTERVCEKNISVGSVQLPDGWVNYHDTMKNKFSLACAECRGKFLAILAQAMESFESLAKDLDADAPAWDVIIRGEWKNSWRSGG